MVQNAIEPTVLAETRPYWFQPGQSGNPKGRPKRVPLLAGLIREYGKGKGDGQDLTRFQLLVERAFSIALNDPDGRIALHAIEVIIDRMDGKAVQPFEDVSVEPEMSDDQRKARIAELMKKAMSLVKPPLILDNAGDIADK
jgi:hypothetical protein